MAVQKISARTASDGLTGDELVPMVLVGGTPEDIQDTTQAIANLSPVVPTGGAYSIGIDANNKFEIGDDGGAYMVLFSGGQNVFQVGTDGAVNGKANIVDSNASFTAQALSGTFYTNEGAAASITATLPDSDSGTILRFNCTNPDFIIYVTPATGLTLVFWDATAGQMQTASDSPLSFLALNPGQSATVVKVSATKWFATPNNGGTYVLD